MAIVIYTGPSMIDGAPIVVLATVESKNVKTGSMVQTWIMRADRSPVDASKRHDDVSICGDCPRRRRMGGDCYVLVQNAPQSAWRSWERDGKPCANWAEPKAIIALQQDAMTYGLRLGSYGDPAAVPCDVWIDFINALQPRSVVGYTHQWRNLQGEQAAWFRDHVMASADSVKDATDARGMGWRYFLAVPASVPVESLPERTVECLATREGSLRTCATCGICDGAQGKESRVSVYLREHGAVSLGKARRAAALVTISP